MSISLSYDDDLSRVQISLSGLSVDAVRVERSTNGLLWETVRGGVALPVSDGVAALDDYEFPPNVQTFYRVLDADDLDGSPLEEDDITPQLGDCEVWLKSIRYPLLNQRIGLFSDYADLERGASAALFDVSGRSFPVATTDVRTAVKTELVFVTESAAEARRLSLLIDLGDVLYLQVPPDGNPQLPPRSMYVVAESSRTFRYGVGERRRHHVAVSEVAAPSPQVVGTTLTWGTVMRLYGSWTQLIAANPSWNDLLAVVGDPDDLVVL